MRRRAEAAAGSCERGGALRLTRLEAGSMEARSGFREAGWEASLYVSCNNDDARLHASRVRSAERGELHLHCTIVFFLF